MSHLIKQSIDQSGQGSDLENSGPQKKRERERENVHRRSEREKNPKNLHPRGFHLEER